MWQIVCLLRGPRRKSGFYECQVKAKVRATLESCKAFNNPERLIRTCKGTSGVTMSRLGPWQTVGMLRVGNENALWVCVQMTSREASTDSRHQLHSFKKLLRGRLWMQTQDSQQVFLSIVCQTWWVTAPPLTTSSAPHNQLLFDRTPSRQMVLREPVSLLNPRTQPHANTHMLVSKHTDASTPEHRRILLPSSWRRARLWDTCSLSGV